MLDGVTDDVLHLDVYLAELVQQLGAWANAATFATIFAETGLGDVCTHGIGRFIDRRLLSGPRRYLRPEHGERAHEFYERHGGMAIVLARSCRSCGHWPHAWPAWRAWRSIASCSTPPSPRRSG